VVGTTGAALAQDELVSGIPYDGYLRGVLVEANGPFVRDEVATEAPSRLVKVEGQAIRFDEPSGVELAEIHAEAGDYVFLPGQRVLSTPLRLPKIA